MRKGRRQGRGIVLIEAMIGVLIFAFGVLGVIGLQAAMARAQTSGKVRADAAALAAEAVASMWVDTKNLAKYDSASCKGYDPCADWLDKVERALPSGAAEVSVNGNAVSVTITWAVPDEGEHRFFTQTTVSQ